MLGWIKDTMLAKDRLSDARAENDKLARLVEYWQERADAERIRADRQLDSLLQQNGLPPVSETTNDEIREHRKATLDQIKEQDEFMAEMFAESVAEITPKEEVVSD